MGSINPSVPGIANNPGIAIILAGGRGSRLGGVDKPQLEVAGSTMRARTAAAALGALGRPTQMIVVGAPGDDLAAPPFTDEGVHTAQLLEDPPFSGPVAGLAAGLERALEDSADAFHTTPDALPARTPVLVLGGDMPNLTAHALRTLVEHPEQDTVRSLADSTGHLQFLAAAWPLSLLADALGTLRRPDTDWQGCSLKRLYAAVPPSRITICPLEQNVDEIVADVDTPDDLDRVRRTAR